MNLDLFQENLDHLAAAAWRSDHPPTDTKHALAMALRIVQEAAFATSNGTSFAHAQDYTAAMAVHAIYTAPYK